MIRRTQIIVTIGLALFVRPGLAEEEIPETEAAQKEMILKLVEINGQLVATNHAMAGRIESLTSLIVETREALQTTLEDRDDKLERVILLTDQLHQMHVLVKRMEERQKELVAEITRLQQAAGEDAAVERGFVAGVVLDVRKNFMEISIGSDDGVDVGQKFDVFREHAFLGQVVVRRTDTDRAVAEIIPDLHKGEIQKGDSVVFRAPPLHKSDDE